MADKNFKVKSGLNIPITSAAILTTDSLGNISSTSTLPIASGGTGQTSANNALNSLLPIQGGGTINYVLQSNGTDTAWGKLYNQTIKDNGTTVTPRGILNIVGGTFADDSGTDTTTLTLSSGVSTSGGSTITASSASVIPLIAKGAASQSADYFQIQNSSGTILAQLNASNQLNINYGSVYSQGGFRGGVNNHIGFAGLSGFAYSPAYLAIGARGAVNQIANLQEWQNSSGTVLNGVNAVGQIFTGSTSSVLGGFAGNSTTAATGDGTTATITTTGVHGLSIGDFITVSGVTPTGYNGTFYVTAVPTTTQISYANATTGAQTIAGTVTFAPQVSITPRSARTAGLVIKGAASQSNNLQQWQNSSGTVLASINNGGSLTLANSGANGIGGLSAGVMWYVVSGSSTYRPLVVQAAASQTGDLTDWQNSSGAVLAKVDASGSATFAGFASSTTGSVNNDFYVGNQAYIYGASDYGSALNVRTRSTSATGIIVRGLASQTADLQEWQNSSGTVLAKVDASGSLTVQDLTVNGTTTTINSTTLTVDDKNIELASVASPTDTTADGAGITIKGATDKTFNWVQSTAAFTSSEPISAPAFKSAGTAVSSNITLVSGYKYYVDTTVARTLTLPASPSLGDEIVIYDASNSALTNNITVGSNSNKIQGSVQDLIIDSNAAVAYLAYTGSTYGWAVN